MSEGKSHRVASPFAKMSSMSRIDAEKLDKAILAQIRRANGEQDWNVSSWQVHLQTELGARPDDAEVVSAMKRLRADGLVRLDFKCPPKTVCVISRASQQALSYPHGAPRQ
jgi:hypothetical protein